MSVGSAFDLVAYRGTEIVDHVHKVGARRRVGLAHQRFHLRFDRIERAAPNIADLAVRQTQHQIWPDGRIRRGVIDTRNQIGIVCIHANRTCPTLAIRPLPSTETSNSLLNKSRYFDRKRQGQTRSNMARTVSGNCAKALPCGC